MIIAIFLISLMISIVIILFCSLIIMIIFDVDIFKAGVILSFLVAFILTVTGCIACEKDKGDRITETIKIYSLDTTTNISGSFTLGCGRIKEEPVYYCYKESDMCGYELMTVENRVIIRITDEVEPHIEKHTIYYNPILGYEFYTIMVVPTNTIKFEYNGNMRR